MLCISYGDSFTDHYQLNEAVRKQFTRSAAASKLKLLQSDGWLDGHTVSLHFTLFSPAPNLFTSVTLQTEQSPPAVMLPSARVSLLTVSLEYYIYYIYRSVIVLEVVELLHKHSYRGHVDVSLLATWEQEIEEDVSEMEDNSDPDYEPTTDQGEAPEGEEGEAPEIEAPEIEAPEGEAPEIEAPEGEEPECIRSLHGVTLFLLTMTCVTVLRVNSSDSLLTRSLCSLLWPTGTPSSVKAPRLSAHFPAPFRRCSVTAGVSGPSGASIALRGISFTVDSSFCPLGFGQQWYTL
ncbi:hypothetical protein NQZ68_035094 [Dissostichus eleginoides]|nr:hypothetical protein NQZ68_035094 [Dissostichus eleginoides]